MEGDDIEDEGSTEMITGRNQTKVTKKVIQGNEHGKEYDDRYGEVADGRNAAANRQKNVVKNKVIRYVNEDGEEVDDDDYGEEDVSGAAGTKTKKKVI